MIIECFWFLRLPQDRLVNALLLLVLTMVYFGNVIKLFCGL